ncbi:TARB1 methyltransferase, partial [Polypterus senegalus]
MSAFLIDTLLSQSGDVCDLIEKLCWETQGNSVPEKENVEVLTHVIRRIRCHLAEKSTQVGLVCKTTLQTKLEDVVNSRCLPTLKKLSVDKSPAARDSSSLRRSICELIAGCAEICSRQLTETLLSASVSSLLLCAEDQSLESSPNPSAGFDFDSAVDILASTIPLLSAQQDNYVRDIKKATIACIKTCGEADFSRVVVKILFPLLNNGELNRSEVLGQLWSGLETWQAIDDCSLVISRLLLILTALSDYLLPSSSEQWSLAVDLRMSERFWEVIQAGVMHPDCVSRKRALYLLKKSVALSAEWKSSCQILQAESKGINLFWWSPEKNKVLLQFWEDYILILETLDENQIHVVKPVLQKIDQVIDAINADNKDGLNLHISWLICIYARMFDSENKAVMKEGVSHLLNLDAVQNPQFSQGLADTLISLDDVANFIMHFRTEESLLRGTLLWIRLCDWLAVHGAQLKPVECIESGDSQMPALSLYAKYAVEMYMRVPLGDGNQIFLPDWFEAERIAKMVILAVDVEEKWKLESDGEKALEKTLDHLLHPLLECLQRLGTSLYLPIQKSDKSLQLLLKLLSVSHTGNLFQQEDDVLQILHERLLFSSEEIFHFLLRRLSGELCLESQLSAQIQKMVSMSSLSLVCELLHHNVDLQTDLNDSVNQIVTYISSMELNTTLLKPTCCDENQRLMQDVNSYVEQLGEDCAANMAITSQALHYGSKKICYCFRGRAQAKRKMLTIAEKVFLIQILDKVYKAGFRNNQPSVKYLIEWFIILTLHYYPKHLHSFWECFNYTIFYTFPRLSDLADDEWIPMWKFENAEFPVDTHISLNNPQDSLTNLVAGDWIQQDKAETDTDNQWTDLQKKMVPWKNSIPEQDLEMIYHERAAKLGKSSSALIVVASLIDKPTNLGGLCRTCEIFAASSLVLSGMHYVTDKQFQALSVSAEHWLPLLEVKPPQLINYLLQKKAEGYTVVGVEQTVNSQSLSDYTFPEKTLLLLGSAVGLLLLPCHVICKKEVVSHWGFRGRNRVSLEVAFSLFTPTCLSIVTRDLSEALREAERAEEVLQAESPTRRTPRPSRLTRAVERRAEGDPSEVVEVSRPTNINPPTETTSRLLFSMRRTRALCQGLPCPKSFASYSITAGKRHRGEAVRDPRSVFQHPSTMTALKLGAVDFPLDYT